jgi:hypothetical protein
MGIPRRVRTEIDRKVEEFLDQGSERVGSRQSRDLIAELEAIENFLDIRRKAVE